MGIKNRIGSQLAKWGGVQTAIWSMLVRLNLDATKTWKDNPTKAMRESEHFFQENVERIAKIKNFLADDLSRIVYTNQILYRQTYDRKKYASPYNRKNQYFPEDIIGLSDKEVFVDCGAYVGDTALRFMKRAQGKYKGIVCFEPQKDNFKLLKNFSQRKSNVAVYCYGVGKESTTLYIDGEGTSAKIEEKKTSSSEKIQICALDDIPECQNATFIKMDIEGFEYEALQGADDIIKKNTPVLAICIYHSDEDMLRIPEMIHEKYPEYDLYVRQHFILPLETVLYAMPKAAIS